MPGAWVQIAVLCASVAAPEGTTTSSVSTGRRALAVGATVVPGLLLHGSGHFVLGDADTAGSLLALEGIGLGTIVAGLAAIAVTGASRKTVAPLTGITIAGAGLFTMTFAADLYGVLGIPVARAQPLAPIETSLGVAYVRDRLFDYGAFATWSLDLRFDDLRLSPSAWVALDDDNARLRGELAYRLAGDSRAAFLDLVTALTHHHYGSDGFAITTGEIAVASRIGTDWLLPALKGSFVEGSFGVGLEGHRFFDRATHPVSLLVGGFGFGFYLPRGEVAVYYDHRHDGFAAGLKMGGLGSGVAGHLGARGEWFFGDLGLRVQAETGSAHVMSAALVYRGAP
ncbi:MAG: hypothetical protein RIT81_17255 [Deltaproteobacteria bacterium]